MRHINYVIAMIALLALAVSSCKDKKETEEVETYSTSATNALVLSFRLQNSKNVSAKLDSVHFTIDPVRGQIYNVDSLPVGTNISSLLTTVSFRSSVRQAKYYLTYSKNGTVQRDTITYRSASTDSMNFTGTVRLEVTSYDGTVTRNYDVHINLNKTLFLVWHFCTRASPTRSPGLWSRAATCPVQAVTILPSAQSVGTTW